MAREPAEWAGPSLGAASAGYSVRVPVRTRPPSRTDPCAAPRTRSRSSMANGHIPLVPMSRTEIGNRRSSDAARARLSLCHLVAMLNRCFGLSWGAPDRRRQGRRRCKSVGVCYISRTRSWVKPTIWRPSPPMGLTIHTGAQHSRASLGRHAVG